MGKFKDFISGTAAKLKSAPKGKQGRAFLRILQFFAVMIVLTIFARGVAAVTMPEVETTGLSQQTIRREEKFSGSVTSSNKIDIKAPAGLTVLRVNVSIGSNVAAGDDLVTFDTALIEKNLLTQRGALLALEQELDTLENSDGTDDTAVKAATKARDQARRAADEAQAAVNSASNTVSGIEGQLRALTVASVQAEVDKAYTDAVAYEKTLETQLATKKSDYANYHYPSQQPPQQVPNPLPDPLPKPNASDLQDVNLYSLYQQAQTALVNGTTAKDDALANLGQVTQIYNDRKAALNDQLSTAQAAVAPANEALTSANEALASAQEALDKAVEDYNKAQGDAVLAEQIRQNNIRLKKLEIAAAQQALDDMNALVAQGGVLKSTADGTVSEITMAQGAVTTEADHVRLSTAGEGYVAEFLVPREKLSSITIGTSVSIMKTGAYWGYDARITSRGAPDESGMVTMRAQLNTTDFKDGDAVEVTAVLSDRSHWSCVPIGAVRPDENKFYVLILTEANTILGTQTMAKKVAVTVVDQNNEYAAIEGTDGYYFDSNAQFILSSNKPVNDGDLVRLGEDSTR